MQFISVESIYSFPELSWMPLKKFANNKIEFFHQYGIERGYGCIALDNIEVGECLLSIPFGDCICAKDEIELMHEIHSASLNREHPMYAHIQRVRNSGSLSGVPLMFDSADLQVIRGKCSLGILHDSMVEPLVSLGFEPWVVAFMLSRCFHSQREEFPVAAVPLADQFNHSTLLFNTRLREVDKEGFFFYAERYISKGEEILNNYGIDSALEMMVTHGFVDPANCITEIVFPLRFLHYTDQAENRTEDLVKIRIDDPDIIPKALMDALPLAEFKENLRNGLIRAVERLLVLIEKIPSTLKFQGMIEIDRSNCKKYLEQLRGFH